MNIVYLTSGPRGSGKSTFINKVLTDSPNTVLISRDSVLVELFGQTSLSPYDGGHSFAQKVVFERIEECLKSNDNAKIMLDYWNGFSSERRRLIRRLKELGADMVICWYFVVSFETCLKWFMLKKDSDGYNESMIRNDYNLFYEESSDIETAGFDGVIYINPRQLLLPSIPII